MTDSTVVCVEKAEMVRVLHAEPAFAEVFTAHLLTRNSRIEADLVDHLFNSSGFLDGGFLPHSDDSMCRIVASRRGTYCNAW